MSIRIGLEKSTREKSVKIIKEILADTYLLYLKTQNFHWNMLDTRFISLHKFLEKQYEELAEAVDEIAERIRMLGAHSPATMQAFLKIATLKEPKEGLTGDQMLKMLLNDHETLIENLRKRIGQTTELEDHGTADMFIQRIRFHEKTAWMLRSHFPTMKN